jgi:hypothetical protein
VREVEAQSEEFEASILIVFVHLEHDLIL